MPPRRTTRISLTPQYFLTRGTQMTLIPTDIEGLPRQRIMEAVLSYYPDIKQPTYNVYDVARVFFGTNKNYVHNIITEVGTAEEMAKHPLAIRPYGGRMRWTLDEVERLIRILSDLQRISYDRTVIALHIVAWTAKAYGLYV